MDLTQLIKQLRDETGVSIMECKKALEKAEMDLDKARIILKEEGLARADKKAERETKAGIVSTFISPDNKIASIVEFRCETDFVAKNEDFVRLANTIAKEIALLNPSSVEEFLPMTMTDGSETIDSAIRSLVALIGEKMEIARFKRITSEGYIGSYTHAGSRLAVLLNINADKDIWNNDSVKELVTDLAMQVAAMSPVSLTPDDLSPVELENIKGFIMEELAKENKPEEIKQKIMTGRLQKRFSDVCLYYQPFIKNDSLTVEKLVEAKGKELGASIKVVEFIRYQS